MALCRCGIRNVLLGGERRPLGGTFTKEVTAFVGSARWGWASINITGSLSCCLFHIRPLLSPLHPIAISSLSEAHPRAKKTHRTAFLLPPGCL